MRQVIKEGRIIVVFESRSNTMKLGEMKKELQDRLDSMYEEDIKDVTERSEPKESESK